MVEISSKIVTVSEDLELAGLIWHPEIGDEISDRHNRDMISILVDPKGLTPVELRAAFLWIPTVEQIIEQIEARQAILSHVGFGLSEPLTGYKAIIKAKSKSIESYAETMRIALGIALRDLLLTSDSCVVN